MKLTFAALAEQLADHLDSEVMAVDDASYVVIPVSAEVEADEVLELREDALAHGGFVFFAEPPTGDEDWAVGLAPGTTAGDAVLAVGTSGGAAGPTSAQLVSWLDGLAALGAFTVTLITPDAIALEFDAPPAPPEAGRPSSPERAAFLAALARSVHAVCPQVHADVVDLLEEGDEELSSDELAAELGLPADWSTLSPEQVLELVFAQESEILLRWEQ